MAIAYGGAGTRWMNGATGVSTWNIPYPASIAAGDLLVVSMESNGAELGTNPTGWTTIYKQTGAALTNPRGGMFYKIATGSESGTLAWPVTPGTTTTMQGTAQMFRYTGVDNTTPLDVAAGSYTNSNAADVAVVLPSLTTVTAGAMLIMMGAPNSGSTTLNAPGSAAAGTTVRVDHGALGGTGNKGGFHADQLLGAAGATGTKTFTWSAARANFGAIAALRPAAGGAAAQTVNPSAIAATAGRGTPTVSTAATAAPGGVSLTAGRGTPVASSVVVTTPTGQAHTAGRGTPTIGTAVLTAPQGASLTSLEGAPAVSTAATIQPTGVGLSAVEGSPAIVSANSPQTVAPGGVGLTAGRGTPGVSTAALAAPAGLLLAANEGTPGVSTAVLVTPAGKQAQAAEGSPVVGTTVTARPAGKALAATPAAPALTTAATAEPDGAGATTAAGAPDLSTGLTAAPTGIQLSALLGAPVAAVSMDQEVIAGSAVVTTNPGNPALAFFFRAIIGIIVEGDRWKAAAGGPRYYTEDDDPARAAASTTHQPPAADPGTRWDAR